MKIDVSVLKDYDVYLGIDVDKKSFAVTVTNRFNVLARQKMASDATQLEKYIQNHHAGQRVLCAYEAGPTGYSLYDHLRSKNYPCFVISPSNLMKAGNERVKNNRLDSQKIAEQLRAGQLRSIRVPEGSYRELRHLVNARENYVEKRREARQRIQSLLLFENLYKQMKDPDKNWCRSYFDDLKQLECNPSVRLRMNALISDHDYACGQLLLVYKQMRQFIADRPDIRDSMKYICTIPGIGFITAVTVLGRIGDPALLNNPREIGCFAGLTPREWSTGDRQQMGRISHFGNGILRSLLVEASWIAIRRDNELKMFYQRLSRNNHPRGSSQKAIVAVARKLTMRIYRVLKDRRPYSVH
jgi:transposase